MHHKPRGFLRDTERAVNLIRGDTVLRVDDHPDRTEPFIESNGTILKDRADLDAELFATALAFPQPASLDEARLFCLAAWASDAIRPAQISDKAQAAMRIGELFDGFEQGFGVHERI